MVKRSIEPEKVKTDISKATVTALNGVLGLARILAKTTGGEFSADDTQAAVKDAAKKWCDQH